MDRPLFEHFDTDGMITGLDFTDDGYIFKTEIRSNRSIITAEGNIQDVAKAELKINAYPQNISLAQRAYLMYQMCNIWSRLHVEDQASFIRWTEDRLKELKEPVL